MKRTLSISALVLVFISAIAFYFGLFDGIGFSQATIYEVTPDNAAIVIQPKSIDQVVAKLDSANYASKIVDFEAVEKLKSQASTIDLCLASSDFPSLSSATDLVMLLQHTSATEMNYLYIAFAPKIDIEKSIANTNAQTEKRLFDGISLWEVSTENNSSVTICEIEGYLMFSFAATLVEQAISKVNKQETLANDEGFKAVNDLKTTADLMLYINYEHLDKLSSVVLSNQYDEWIEDTKQTVLWSAMDVLIQEDGIIMNGYSSADAKNKLVSYKGEQIQEDKIIEVLPNNTATFSLGNMQAQASDDVYIEALPYFTGWSTGQYAYFAVESFDGDIEEETCLAIATNDVTNALKNLADFADLLSSTEEQEVGAYTIKQLYCDRELGMLYNSSFYELVNPYYTAIGNCIVLSNSNSTLQNIIESYEAGKVLKNSAVYQNFEKSISIDGHSVTYFNPKKNGEVLKAMQANDGLVGLSMFESIGLKYTWSGDNLITSAYLGYQGKSIPNVETPTNTVDYLWVCNLDTTTNFSPVLVKNHNNSEWEIITQDDAYNVYLIDKTGAVLWKTNVSEPILGGVHQIDAYKNDKLQYVFNTTNFIHVLDRNGASVMDYPLKLTAEASCGMSVFDYDKNRKYRFFVPTTSGDIYGYNADGKPLAGWSPKKDVGVMKHPMMHTISAGKDYLIATTSTGKIISFSRTGERRFTDISGKSGFDSQSTIDVKGTDFYITNATDGTLYQVGKDGKTYTNDVSETSEKAMFCMMDFDGAKNGMFVFLDNNTLTCVKRKGFDKLHTYKFDMQISNQLKVITLNDGEQYIAIYSRQEGKIFLLDNTLKMVNGFSLKGSTDFSVADIFGNGTNVAIVGHENGVYTYRIN